MTKSFLEHAQVITKRVSEARPVLQGVMHYEDGKMVVTDGHVLYRKENGHSLGKNICINPKTMQEIDDNYPDTDRLIPDTDNAKTVVTLAVNKHIIAAMKQSVKAAKVNTAGDKERKAVLFINVDDEFDQSATFETSLSYFHQSFTAEAEGEPLQLRMDYQYFVEALEMLLDDSPRAEENVQIHLFGETCPLILKNDYPDSPTALLMPIREN